MIDLISETFISLHTEADSYTALHAALIDLVITVRTIKQTRLLLYLKKALVTLFIDQEGHDGNQAVLEELQHALQSDDPLPVVDFSTLSTVLTTINTRLEPLDFEIVESKDMDDSSINIFSFVNKKPTGAIRLSTKYSQNDIQLVKYVIERIFGSEYVNKDSVTDENGELQPQITYSVPYMQMVKFLRDGPEIAADEDSEESTPIITRLSLEESDLFLKDLECYGWLERTHDHYTLGARGLVELKKYLIDTYGKVPNGTISMCYGCGDVLTRGLACSNGSCNIRFHRYCCKLVRKSRDNDSCPNPECNESIKNFYSF